MLLVCMTLRTPMFMISRGLTLHPCAVIASISRLYFFLFCISVNGLVGVLVICVCEFNC